MRRAIASTFGVGLVPRRLWGSDTGAGTFGAGAAWLLAAPWWGWEWWVVAALAVIATSASLWSAAPFAAGGRDPGWVCIDETAGTLVALIGLTGWGWVTAAAVARMADIYKVLPGISPAERLPGPIGVTIDDIIAGGYGLAAGWLVAALTG